MTLCPLAAPCRAHRRRWLRAVAACSAALLLAACAEPGPPRPDENAIRAFAARGYLPAAHHAVTVQRENWLVRGQLLPVTLATPAQATPQPLVVYLPGLGETSDAGERWRSAWAAAGYAVLSLQLLNEDATAWQSDLARGGEFHELGRQRFAPAPMTERLQMLDAALAEARRRSAAGQPGLQHIDWRRVALAGFDLGAYTAMAAAGEEVRGVERPMPPASATLPRAVLALSPHASSSAGAADTRWSGIALPVLSVTGDGDGDLLGLVDSPALRRLPFDHLHAPGTLLLNLQGLAHPGFGGDVSMPAQRANAVDAPPRPERADSDGVPQQQQRRGGRSRQGAIPSNPRPDADRDAGNNIVRPRMTPTTLQLRAAALEAVSTAFLDAQLKDEPRARAWLANDAPGWLDDLGTIESK